MRALLWTWPPPHRLPPPSPQQPRRRRERGPLSLVQLRRRPRVGPGRQSGRFAERRGRRFGRRSGNPAPQLGRPAQQLGRPGREATGARPLATSVTAPGTAPWRRPLEEERILGTPAHLESWALESPPGCGAAAALERPPCCAVAGETADARMNGPAKHGQPCLGPRPRRAAVRHAKAVKQAPPQDDLVEGTRAPPLTAWAAAARPAVGARPGPQTGQQLVVTVVTAQPHLQTWASPPRRCPPCRLPPSPHQRFGATHRPLAGPARQLGRPAQQLALLGG